MNVESKNNTKYTNHSSQLRLQHTLSNYVIELMSFNSKIFRKIHLVTSA